MIALRAFARDLRPFVEAFSQYSVPLARLNAPATIVWGADDRVLRPDRLVHRFAEDLRVDPADIHVLPQANHFLREGRPGDIADLIGRFVRASAAAAQ